MITVEELMSSTLYTLPDTASLYSAHQLMKTEKIRHIPIVDENNMFVGLLTQRDLLSAAVSVFADISDAEREELESGIPVKEIMSTDIIVAEEDASLNQAAQFLLETKHGCLPIVAKGYLKGILTEADFVKLALKLLKKWQKRKARKQTSASEQLSQAKKASGKNAKSAK